MKGNEKERRTDMVWGLPPIHSDGTSVPSVKGGRETRRGKCVRSVSRSRLSTPIKEVGVKEEISVCALSFPLPFLSCELSFKVPCH
jgi:hypothetical protein